LCHGYKEEGSYTYAGSGYPACQASFSIKPVGKYYRIGNDGDGSKADRSYDAEEKIKGLD